MSRSRRTLAKVSAPALARKVVPRTRLFARLDALRRRGVVWIVAGPGAGKTSLVASWLLHERRPHLWLQLDADDADVATFFHYLARAAEGLCRRVSLPAFTPDYLPAPEAFARRFFRALCAGVRGPVVLVLEDYHELRPDSPVHAALAAGLRELPEQVSAVVTSRAGPPPALARLRMSGALEVLRGEELSLSLGETRSVARLWGFTERDRDLMRSLHERTEGWAAGLVLLLAGGRDGVGALQEREGALFDYFAQEVFGRAPPATRRVLLETALLRRVEAAVAVRLTGVAGAGAILADLSRRGYFVVRIEAERETYQLHALFREFLLRRSEVELSARRRAELRVRAAGVLEERGQLEEAFQLYREAGAWDEVARLVRAQAAALLDQARAETVEGWLASLPDAIRERDPWLLYWRGRARAPFDPRAARAYLLRAFALFREAADAAGAFRTWAAVAQTHLWEVDDQRELDHWIVVLDELREQFPDFSDPDVEPALVGAAFAALHNRQPDHPALRHWERRALALALTAGNPQPRTDTAASLLQYYGVIAADLDRARLIGDTFAPLVAAGPVDLSTAVRWHMSLGYVHLCRGELEQAGALAERGLRLSTERELYHWEAMLLGLLCLAQAGAGDLAAAGRTLSRMAAAAARAPKLGQSHHHYVACILARQRGDLRAAREHGLRALEVAVAAGMAMPEADCMLTLALAEPDASALPALERAVERGRQIGARLVHATALLGLALWTLRRGDEAGAVEPLREGLAIARSCGILHFVHFGPEELAEVCAVALAHGMEPDHTAAIIRARKLAPTARGRDLEAWPWELRIEALGGFEVSRGGERLRPARKAQKKPIDVLRLLVASGERGLRQEALAEALWPDADGDAALHALATTLYRTRKLLGRGDALLQQGGRVALDPAVVFVDAWALQHALERAEGARTGGASPAPSTVERIRALCAGDLHGPDAEDPWLREYRDRLRRRAEPWLGPARPGFPRLGEGGTIRERPAAAPHANRSP